MRPHAPMLVITCAIATLVGVAAFAGSGSDDCADAEPIYQTSWVFSTIDATTDGLPHADCQFDGQTYHDIWFSYTTECNGDMRVSTCGLADYDTDLVVYVAGDCPPGDDLLVACNDDGDGCPGFTSEVFTKAECGTTYLIRVGGWNEGDVGTGELMLECSGAPCSGCKCEWDLNGDCWVDAADLASLLSGWNRPYDAGDLAALLAEWGECLYLP